MPGLALKALGQKRKAEHHVETNFKPWVSESECPQISERKLWVEILKGAHTFYAHDLHCGDCTILLCFSLTNTDMALIIFQHYSKCFTSINSFHLEILIFKSKRFNLLLLPRTQHSVWL